ncbi:hypothetical protein BD311DRAFT_658188 [Dichomitus squalens]|uniref:FAD/NAD(P)-binding domain-containing protein n=1 Tax=Dichomitus squalens TaxID=114155 RepID=A0A4Q9MVW9_9APHY|nr:hypothetical protein BD311DRAFT_658188 [Dichomitus squalens]
MSTTHSSDYDSTCPSSDLCQHTNRFLPQVIIVGGGPAGCATALSIARRTPEGSVRILIIDDADPSAYKIGESLPAAARRSLSMLDPSLLPRLTEDTSRGLHDVCTGNASAWASADLHETYSLMNPYGAGWHLDRARFDDMLRQTCGSMLWRGKIVGVRRADGGGVEGSPVFGWDIDAKPAGTSSMKTFRTRWLVDATGRKASVAQKIGAKMRKHSDLLAFYVVFDRIDPDSDRADDNDTRTLIEAAPSGWWYSARLPHGKRLVMYTTSPWDATARVARTAAGFLDMLQSDTVHISRSLCEMPLYEMPPGTKFTRCTTAASSILDPYTSWESQGKTGGGEHDRQGRGWCAVGDAALAFDPLSSQGIITALNAGAFLGSVLARHLHPSAAEGSHLEGSEAVREIRQAYERVREKYEEGRAYYYRIVRRFDVTSDSDNPQTDEGAAGFWRAQS